MSEDFVFISYRRTDEKSALLLHKGLEAAFGQGKIWLDHDSIQVGTTWRERIEDGVARCSAFIILIGQGWTDSAGRLHDDNDVVRAEIEQALRRRMNDKDRLPVIPLRFDGVDAPSDQDLPSSLRPLVDIDSESVRDDKFSVDLDGTVIPSLVPHIGEVLTHVSPRQKLVRALFVLATFLVLLGVSIYAGYTYFIEYDLRAEFPFDPIYKAQLENIRTEGLVNEQYLAIGKNAAILFVPMAIAALIGLNFKALFLRRRRRAS